MKVKNKKALAVREKKTAISAFDPEIVEVIRKTIAPSLTDIELKVYLGVCRRYNADPIMKDIVPIVFKSAKHGSVLNFIITRDFLLKKANKAGVLDGLHSTILRNDKGGIVGATAEAWKKGSERSYKIEVDFKEYYNDKNDLWGKFPGAMIRKVAESIVLKRICGIDLVSDVELEKNGGSIVRISDIVVPKTKFTVSDQGRIKKETVIEAETVEKESKVL